MSDLLEQLGAWFKEKTTSPIYFTYFSYVVLWNWKIFYVLFFEDSSMFSKPKIEYVSTMQNYVDTLHVWTWVNPILSFTWHLIPPVFFTWITIKYSSIIYFWALNIHIENKFAYKKKYYEEKLKYEKSLLENQQEISIITKKRVEETKTQVEQEGLIEKNLSNEDRWGLEVIQIHDFKFWTYFLDLTTILYENNGKIYQLDKYNNFVRSISAEGLAKLHTKNIIMLSGTGYEEKIELTDKGTYYLNYFLDNKDNLTEF